MGLSNKIHIVSFNVPYPADYGGVIDVFYKIRQLHGIGAEIYLHCFTYGRQEAGELNKYCQKVFYYKRQQSFNRLFSNLPYIIATRNSPELLNNILNIKAPILFEGLHTCFFINHPKLKNYRKIIRMHNIEHEYYAELAKAEADFLKKIYFKRESRKLKKFEQKIIAADSLLTISKSDQQYFSKIHRNSNLVPGFHEFETVTSKTGKGDYILFHGNLGVAENKRAVKFILKDVAIQEHFPIIIAGKNPSTELIKSGRKFPNLKIVANPSEEKMNELMQNAHVCFIPTFQPTGLKLKLLGSLFASRFCVTNSIMVKNTGLEQLCTVSDSTEELKNCIFGFFLKSFTEEDIKKRKEILERDFSNKTNAKRLFTLIKSDNR